MMATMGEAERNAFLKMPRSVRIAFPNRLCSSKNQFCKQDCITTVAGSVLNSAPSSNIGDLFEEDSLFAKTSPSPSTPLVVVPSGTSHPFMQRLPSSGEPPATPSSMLCACCNLNKVPMDYPNLLSKFVVCHCKETIFSFVQSMHSDKDTMSPICAGELYQGRYNASCLAAEVRLGLQSASLAPDQISAQNAHTIAIQNEYIDEVAWIWSLELAAKPCVSSNPGPSCPGQHQLALLSHFQGISFSSEYWQCQPLSSLGCRCVPLHVICPNICQSGQPGYAGCCLEHYCALAYQLQVLLLLSYSYMEDTLMDCLLIGAAFSACGGWGCLVPVSQLCLLLCNWTSMLQNSQLAWSQMLVILVHMRQHLDDNR
ncbi:hypothetical protein DSO57_1039774 [Entomophthora muscae]|uniref:Uncharacterized protein n=1 Tax=Entomophthora muscae TaxID=34485 RepID=A0ACC2TL48_9FUNG|nr:hypothetical protein DSO57_1039774 [Entomophthora muscae]